MRYGKHVKALEKMAKRGKLKGPARLLGNRPQLDKHLVHLWEAFQRLATCRPLTMGGPGPIPWTAVDQYAVRYRYVGYQYDELIHFVEFLDGVYLQSQVSAGKGGGANK